MKIYHHPKQDRSEVKKDKRRACSCPKKSDIPQKCLAFLAAG
jgi:hypothetical protein